MKGGWQRGLRIAGIILAAAGAGATAGTLTPVNVCYSALTATQATVWYAYEKGLFQKYGLQVKLVFIPGGARAATTLISGDMDISQIGAPPVVNAAAARKDIVIIAGLINVASGSLMAQPRISSMAMLVGKTVGTNDGSNTDSVLRLILRKHQLDPGRDVKMLNIGGDPERAAALEARQVDATLVTPPHTFELQKKGFVNLYDADRAKIPYQSTCIATTRKYLTSHRAAVTSFMTAIQEAIVRIKHDPQGSKAVMAQYMVLDPAADAGTLQQSYDSTLLEELAEVPYPTIPGLQIIIDMAAKDNPGAARVKPQDIVDVSILDDLKRAGLAIRLR
jgi:NitT/TauT family transport system substrate-binding protein